MEGNISLAATTTCSGTTGEEEEFCISEGYSFTGIEFDQFGYIGN